MLVLFSKVWVIKSCNRCPYGACLPEVSNNFVEGNAAEYANNEAREKVKHGSFLTGRGSFVSFTCNLTRMLKRVGCPSCCVCFLRGVQLKYLQFIKTCGNIELLKGL